MKFANGFQNSAIASNKFLILGLLIRLVLAAFTAHPTDMQSWKTIGAAIYSGQNPYAVPAYGLVYPPLWGLVCSIAYAIYAPTQDPFVFSFMIKLPIIAADIAVAKTIETIVLTKTKNRRNAQKAMMLYLFNPVTVIISSLWGMFDAIPAFLVILSTVFLGKKQYVKSSLTLGVAIAFKGIYPALLLPLFLYAITAEEGKPTRAQKPLKYLTLSMLVPAIASIPFLMADAKAFVNMTISHYVQRPLSNLTYWLAIHFAFPQNQSTVSALSFVTFAVVFLTIYAYLLKQADTESIMEPITQVILAFYLTSPTVNEQYLIWLLPPMIIYAMTKKQRMLLFIYALTIIVTTYTMANAGTSFFLPINPQLGQIQHLWPAMVVCALIFPVVSIIALRKTMKGNKGSNGG